ncbi:MAG TPA: 50S ribosomal protein L16 [Candidatus Dormibacteraeota bacterium]|jgi:large subunit ribosomal protein L10e|nr:50S ribosomal protein L16 [Candidatus Dormibacteraeota bacterium]
MKGRNYRSPRGQAFTRMKYIHGSPAPKVSKFNMGDTSVHYPRLVHLVSMEAVQIRHNALESGRVAANKVLFDKYGETGYRLQLCVYPHIILRENKMIATAGADRLQEGMRRAFGKPTGRAARVRQGQSIYIVHVPADGVETGKKACETAGTKMPMRTRIIIEEVAVGEQVSAPVEAPMEPEVSEVEEPAETSREIAPVA